MATTVRDVGNGQTEVALTGSLALKVTQNASHTRRDSIRQVPSPAGAYGVG